MHIIYDLNNYKYELYTKNVGYTKSVGQAECRLYTKSVGYTRSVG